MARARMIVTDDQKAEILRIHGEGATVYAIEQLTGVGKWVILRIVDPAEYARQKLTDRERSKTPGTPRARISPETKAEVFRLDAMGLTSYRIGEELGIPHGSVHNILHKSEINERRNLRRNAAIEARKELTPDVVQPPAIAEQVRDLYRRKYKPQAIAAMTKQPYAEIIRVLGQSA